MLYQYNHTRLADFGDPRIKSVLKEFLSTTGKAAGFAPKIIIAIVRLKEEHYEGGNEPVSRERVYAKAGIEDKDMPYAWDLIKALTEDGVLSVARIDERNVMKDRLILNTFTYQVLTHLCYIHQRHDTGKGILPTA